MIHPIYCEIHALLARLLLVVVVVIVHGIWIMVAFCWTSVAVIQVVSAVVHWLRASLAVTRLIEVEKVWDM